MMSINIQDFITIRNSLYKMNINTTYRDEIIEKLRVVLENGVENKKKRFKKCIYKNVICDPEYFKG